MRRYATLLIALAAAAALWQAAAELPRAARFWTTLLFVALPWLMIQQARVQDLALEVPRAAIYAQSGALHWLLAGATAGIAAVSGFGLADLGLRLGRPFAVAVATATATAAGIGLVIAANRLGLEDPPIVKHLMPVTRGEKYGFAALSVTAGLCEEFVFRGFLIHALAAATASTAVAVLASSALFGVSHAYQRVAGAARAGVLGAMLALPLVVTGSLWPSIIAHAAIDLAAGFWLRDRLLPGA